MTISGRAYCHTATHYAYSSTVDWPSVPVAILEQGCSRLEHRHGWLDAVTARRDFHISLKREAKALKG